MEFKLNFPVETEEAQRFWASKHRLNRIKAIIAFSTDMKNANDNLRRAGYSYMYRQKYLKAYKCYVNSPSMKIVMFSDLQDEWFDPIPCTSAVALIPEAGYEKYISNWNQRKQIITLQLADVVNCHADRLENDGSANGGMGHGSIITGEDKSIVNITSNNDRNFTITAIKLGETKAVLTSGDKTSKTEITIKVII
ncbi:hypothetical protein [Klebsiella pneumoniae]|nr:hypothetical protein [Klebsiella pneumoniae]